jgi:hypothetical protein
VLAASVLRKLQARGLEPTPAFRALCERMGLLDVLPVRMGHARAHGVCHGAKNDQAALPHVR